MHLRRARPAELANTVRMKRENETSPRLADTPDLAREWLVHSRHSVYRKARFEIKLTMLQPRVG